MNYDPNLVDQLSAFPTEKFDGEVYRVTREGADPTAPSYSGGRWARPQNGDPGTAVLYTSLERDGALAEVTSYYALLSPLPNVQLKVTTLAVTTSRTLRLLRTDLSKLGIDMSRYGDRDYVLTQEIGSTLAWLSLDGLIAPSARWKCDNLMIFTDNHALGEKLDVITEGPVDWKSWAESNGILPAKP
jgi:RES domain-containing protein